MPATPHFYLWLNGEARKGISKITVNNPYDDKPVATVSVAGRRLLREAIKSAGVAFHRLRIMSRFERAEILANMADGLNDAKTETIDALILEGGKPRMFAEQEHARTLAVFSWAAEEAKRFAGEQIPMDGMQRGIGYEGYTRREPIGPILGICPFNFPLNLVAHKVAPALAVGNSIIIKPASSTPISALILARISSDAGAPAGSVNVLPVRRHRDIPVLLEDEHIKMISFTGSAAVGWSLKTQIGKKRIALELGGNSGSIVDVDADIDWAAERLALGSFAQAGQSCIAVQRIYAHQGIYDAFLERLVEQAKDTKAGKPINKDVVVGPVISSNAADRIMAWIEEAVTAGATIACGGKRLKLGSGNVIEPTVLTDVKEDMRVCRKEVFGPVVTVSRFASIEDAIARVNQSDSGLQAAIFSNSMAHVQSAVDGLEVGGIVVNDFPTYRVDHMPYGGVKNSGQGREGVRYTMLEMTEEKMVVIRR